MLDKMEKVLADFQITKRKSKGCACGKDSYIYTLPIGLDSLILEHLVAFGMAALDFEKTRLLKMGNAHYSVTGIKKLKEIRFTAKSKKGLARLVEFEDTIMQYVEGHPKMQKRDEK